MAKQHVKGYVREVHYTQYICACPNCPHCHNQQLTGHLNRKYCSHDAMLEARRQRRIAQAISAGRTPGKIGRPKKDIEKSCLYVLHLCGTNLYLLGWSDNRTTYQQELATHQRRYPNSQELWVFDCLVTQADMAQLYQQFDQHLQGQWLKFDSQSIQELKATIEKGILTK